MQKYSIKIAFSLLKGDSKWTTTAEAAEILCALIMENIIDDYMPNSFELSSKGSEDKNVWFDFNLQYSREFETQAKAILWVHDAENAIIALWNQKKDFIDNVCFEKEAHTIELS
jgi:hypothetical protein